MILLLTSPNLTFLKGLIQKETVDSDDYDIGWKGHLQKKKREQNTVDHNIHGKECGHYFMFLSPKVFYSFFKLFLALMFFRLKGSGKSTMILESMDVCQVCSA